MEKVKQYLLENMDVLKDSVRELNSWDGSFDNLDVWENDEEFFNTFFEGRVMDAVRASQYGEYDYTDELVRFDGYGNLESLSDSEFEDELRSEVEDIIDSLIDNKANLDLDSVLEEMLEEIEEND